MSNEVRGDQRIDRNLIVGGYFEIEEEQIVSAPSSNRLRIHKKTGDDNLYLISSSGSVFPLVSNLSSTSSSGILLISKGGTGLSTTPSNGQLLIGNGTGYSLATLTEGTGVTIVNSAGSITISSTGGGGSSSGSVYIGTPKRISSVDFGNSFTVVGNTTSGSATISSLTSTSRILPGMTITGTNIPSGTVVSSITSSTAIVVSQSSTGTTSSVTFTFNAPINTPITLYTVPASTYTQICKLNVINRNANTANVFIGHGGISVENYIASGMLVLPNETKQITFPGFQPTDILKVSSDISDVNFLLTGFEGSTAINQQKLASFYIDGSTYTVNTDYVMYISSGAISASIIVCNEATASSTNIRTALINGNSVVVGSGIAEGSNSFYKSDYIIFDDTLLNSETKIFEGDNSLVGFIDMSTNQSIVVRASTAGTNFILWRAQ